MLRFSLSARLCAAVLAPAVALSVLSTRAGAQQQLASCDPASPAALAFNGLPSSVDSGKSQVFGLDSNLESGSTVPGQVDVTMIDRHGKVFFHHLIDRPPRDLGVLGVRLDLGDRFVHVMATYTEVGGDGTQCTRTLDRRVRERRRIFFPSRCTNRRLKPASVIVACGDGNLQLRRMRWRGWNKPVVRGRGLALYNDCIPYCAAGHFHTRPIIVRLSRPRRCAGFDRYAYTRLEYRAPGTGQRFFPVSFPCSAYIP